MNNEQIEKMYREVYYLVQDEINKLKNICVIDDTITETKKDKFWSKEMFSYPFQVNLRKEYEKENPNYVAWICPIWYSMSEKSIEGIVIEIYLPRKGSNYITNDLIAYLNFEYEINTQQYKIFWDGCNNNINNEKINDIVDFLKQKPIPECPFIIWRDNSD